MDTKLSAYPFAEIGQLVVPDMDNMQQYVVKIPPFQLHLFLLSIF